MRRVTAGEAEPLGATVTETGVNFAVWSSDADVIEVCLFGAEGEVERERHVLPARSGPIFHGHIEGLKPGDRYGLRAHGPFDPARGLRFNPNKLLVDPYALRLDAPFQLHASQFAYRLEDPQGGASYDESDSAPSTPKAVIVSLRPIAAPIPHATWDNLVIYELNIKGFTQYLDKVPEMLRGTFRGLAHPASVDHLTSLGVTAVELLPTAAWIDERHLPPLGLANAWGYNPVVMSAPDPKLAPGGWADVREAVEALAAAGVATILDVVLNHTGEGDELGPTLSLRGLDNRSYYRLAAEDPARYVNDAGTGNVLALDRGAGVRLAMDALRAWRRFGGVAGFRFDLATVLGRRAGGFDADAPLLLAIEQDPDLRDLILIAEPWDCGPDGRQLGRFPPAWGEWNDQYRTTVRRFWRGDGVSLGEFARRVSGSADVFPARPLSRSVNYVTAHDGFTLADLVSFENKHNEANGEQGRDGADANDSWNHGVEGPTQDPRVRAARLQDQRTLLATLLLSKGTPMLSMGMELGRTQGGNNNAYAQADGLNAVDWTAADADLIAFTRHLIAARRSLPAMFGGAPLSGAPKGRGVEPDVAWRSAAGEALTTQDWEDPRGATLQVRLADDDGDACIRAVVVFHRGVDRVQVRLPTAQEGQSWSVLLDSADPGRRDRLDRSEVEVAGRSVVVLTEAADAAARGGRGVDDSVLARLASAAGVAAAWKGLDGTLHRVTADTQLALLEAMRLPAASTRQALESLRDLTERLDRAPLPPHARALPHQTFDLALPLDADTPPPRTWLTLEGEDGEVVRVRVSASEGRIVAGLDRDGVRRPRLMIPIPALRPGRYRLRREDRPDAVGRLTAAPERGYVPEAFNDGGRRFGLSVQLYGARRAGDQGVGDFTSLGDLAQAAAAAGASLLAINPLHALFEGRRDRVSPYYPSDRRFLDPIYLDVADFDGAGEAASELLRLSRLDEVDYDGVWRAKTGLLEAAYRDRAEAMDLDRYIARGGKALEAFTRFQLLSELHPEGSWRDWPASLHDPDSAAVRDLAQRHASRARFHAFCQQLCDAQLADAARRAEVLDLGLCRDLAVGAAPFGAEAWSNQDALADKVSIGAPPDPFGPQGQVWGLPPLIPHRLLETGLQASVELMAANMRCAGALRIDHVMGLSRQFWVPAGGDAADGAYVSYPLDNLLAELSLESHRARCLIIGEDLGSVPEGFRETLEASRVLSYRVLPFERFGDRYRPPETYPRLALACVATHDLPPLFGWWAGEDIRERLDLGLLADAASSSEFARRRVDKAELALALREAGLADGDLDVDAPLTPQAAAAVHAFLARAPSVLALAQVEDLCGERIAVNVPGTDQERANWRRRLARPIPEIFDNEPARSILEAMRRARP